MVLKSTAVNCVESVGIFTGIKGYGDAKTYIPMTNSNACSLVLRSGHGKLWKRGRSTLHLAELPNSTFAKARTQDARKACTLRAPHSGFFIFQERPRILAEMPVSIRERSNLDDLPCKTASCAHRTFVCIWERISSGEPRPCLLRLRSW